MTRWTSADLAAVAARQAKPAKSKYGAVKTEAFGIVFDSKREAARFGELRLLERADEIRALVAHPRYELRVNGDLVAVYEADASYLERDPVGGTDLWFPVVEDTKGVRTPVYKLKVRLMKAIHNIDIREVR